MKRKVNILLFLNLTPVLWPFTDWTHTKSSTVAFFELRWMGISSYATLLDEYSEHNFCTGSSSSKAFATLSHTMSI